MMFFGSLLKGLRKELMKTPNKSVNHMSGLTYKELSEEISSLLNWACPTIDSKRLKAVIPCSKCLHYKTFKKRSNPRVVVKLCEFDKQKKPLEFYCAKGEEYE